jgi:DNA polymerase V
MITPVPTFTPLPAGTLTAARAVIGLPCPLPLMAWPVRAGFASPAEDYIEARLDLNDLLSSQPEATFFVRVRGRSMVKAGIDDGDLLVVNRALQATHGDIIIAVVDGDHTVKRLHAQGGIVRLVAESDEHPSIHLVEGQTLEVWGVVTSVIKQFRQ